MVVLKVTFRGTTLKEFGQHYLPDISPSGMFVRTKDPLIVGTKLRFEFRLENDQPLLFGQGVVLWVAEESPDLHLPAGMELRFESLTPESEQCFQWLQLEKRGVTVGTELPLSVAAFGSASSDPARSSQNRAVSASSCASPSAPPRPASSTGGPSGFTPLGGSGHVDRSPASITGPLPALVGPLAPSPTGPLPAPRRSPSSTAPQRPLATAGIGPQRSPAVAGTAPQPLATAGTGPQRPIIAPETAGGAPRDESFGGEGNASSGSGSHHAVPTPRAEAEPASRPAPLPRPPARNSGQSTSPFVREERLPVLVRPVRSELARGQGSGGNGDAARDAAHRASLLPGDSDPAKIFHTMTTSHPDLRLDPTGRVTRPSGRDSLTALVTSRRPAWAIVLAVLGLIFVALLVRFFVRTPDAPPETTPRPPPPVTSSGGGGGGGGGGEASASAIPRLVRVLTEPSGAAVLLGERRLGTTPLDVRLGAERRLVLRHRGYHAEELTLSDIDPRWVQEAGRMTLALRVRLRRLDGHTAWEPATGGDATPHHRRPHVPSKRPAVVPAKQDASAKPEAPLVPATQDAPTKPEEPPVPAKKDAPTKPEDAPVPAKKPTIKQPDWVDPGHKAVKHPSWSK